MIKFGTVVGNITDSKDFVTPGKEVDTTVKSPFKLAPTTNP